jgi:inhibitor of KinA sporulation pathway (predicted exonuclease)
MDDSLFEFLVFVFGDEFFSNDFFSKPVFRGGERNQDEIKIKIRNILGADVEDDDVDETALSQVDKKRENTSVHINGKNLTPNKESIGTQSDQGYEKGQSKDLKSEDQGWKKDQASVKANKHTLKKPISKKKQKKNSQKKSKDESDSENDQGSENEEEESDSDSENDQGSENGSEQGSEEESDSKSLSKDDGSDQESKKILDQIESEATALEEGKEKLFYYNMIPNFTYPKQQAMAQKMNKWVFARTTSTDNNDIMEKNVIKIGNKNRILNFLYYQKIFDFVAEASSHQPKKYLFIDIFIEDEYKLKDQICDFKFIFKDIEKFTKIFLLGTQLYPEDLKCESRESYEKQKLDDWKVQTIPGDGNCLYSAILLGINKYLETKYDVQKLREIVKAAYDKKPLDANAKAALLISMGKKNEAQIKNVILGDGQYGGDWTLGYLSDALKINFFIFNANKKIYTAPIFSKKNKFSCSLCYRFDDETPQFNHYDAFIQNDTNLFYGVPFEFQQFIKGDIPDYNNEEKDKESFQQIFFIKGKFHFDYYIVIDVEATTDTPELEEPEMIEWAAVVLDADGNKINKFHMYIKPKVLPQKTLDFTKIKRETIENADSFIDVLPKFDIFVEKYKTRGVIVTDAPWDVAYYIKREIVRSGPNPKDYWFMNKWVNVAKTFKDFKGNEKLMGFKDMLEQIKQVPEGNHHSGIDDALNISKIAKYLIENYVLKSNEKLDEMAEWCIEKKFARMMIEKLQNDSNRVGNIYYMKFEKILMKEYTEFISDKNYREKCNAIFAYQNNENNEDIIKDRTLIIGKDKKKIVFYQTIFSYIKDSKKSYNYLFIQPEPVDEYPITEQKAEIEQIFKDTSEKIKAIFIGFPNE